MLLGHGQPQPWVQGFLKRRGTEARHLLSSQQCIPPQGSSILLILWAHVGRESWGAGICLEDPGGAGVCLEDSSETLSQTIHLQQACLFHNKQGSKILDRDIFIF